MALFLTPLTIAYSDATIVKQEFDKTLSGESVRLY